MSVGTFCLVLHSHLPWVAHHGAWPVGEEWLHQAWARSYGPVFEVLDGLARDGFTDVLTLGVTPILAAQLDDPYCIAQHDIWLSDWQLRAIGRASSGTQAERASGSYEYAQARAARKRFEAHWSRGGSPFIRSLWDAGVIDLLGGPATHPFQPLLDDRVLGAGLRAGLEDATLRWGSTPAGIWAPECGYRPGIESHYASAGVQHFLVDGPTLATSGYSTATPYRVQDTVIFGRDLDVTYRVWSPRKGYPGGRWYQDFHTYDHTWGMKSARVTSSRTAPHEKAPYEPAAAQRAVLRDADDFVAHIVRRLALLGQTTPHPLVVTAYDTELFGHWWHEGPEFLDRVLRTLPDAGVEVSTLSRMQDRAEHAIEIGASSWGSGKDWRVWDGEQVHDIVALNETLQVEFLTHLDAAPDTMARSPHLDDAWQQLLLALSSDWAFMITKDSAAEYARDRARTHASRMREILHERAPSRDGDDRPFGHLDARVV